MSKTKAIEQEPNDNAAGGPEPGPEPEFDLSKCIADHNGMCILDDELHYFVGKNNEYLVLSVKPIQAGIEQKCKFVHQSDIRNLNEDDLTGVLKTFNEVYSNGQDMAAAIGQIMDDSKVLASATVKQQLLDMRKKWSEVSNKLQVVTTLVETFFRKYGYKL